MCNLYIMYYMDSKHVIPYMNCMETGSKELFQHIPAEANVPITVSPGHMNSMMHMGHSTGTKELDIVHVYCCNPKCFNLGLSFLLNGQFYMLRTFLHVCLLVLFNVAYIFSKRTFLALTEHCFTPKIIKITDPCWIQTKQSTFWIRVSSMTRSCITVLLQIH